MNPTILETPPDYDETRTFERPDGFYWQAKQDENGAAHGPFATLIDAVLDMQQKDQTGLEPGESVAEAASEIGIADWVDPETGEPAEESVPRIEDH